MDKQTTLQNPSERQTEQSQHMITSTLFQTLKELPIPIENTQCVLYKHEILICGNRFKRDCYSYHILKNEYKFICEYPRGIELDGHCVMKLVDNNSNEITLLSFGGDYKHTLVMKYVSVWSNDNNNNDNEMDKSKEVKKLNNYNEWVPFTDNHNNQIEIGRSGDYYIGVRAVIGGSNNHLLFIAYYPNNISVFDLNTFQFIKYGRLPTKRMLFHCFISKPEKNKNKIYELLLFCWDTGLSIEYDEDKNTFQFHELPVCDDIKPFFRYAYVCINDIILFFGGRNAKLDDKSVVSKSVYKYSIQENKWMIFQNNLPNPLYDCVAILSEDDNHIHIIGGQNDKNTTISTHMKTKVRVWDASLLSKHEIKFIIQHWVRTLKIKLGWINDFDELVFKYSKKDITFKI
ncbi:hypothetical protein RFI_04642 [Reticulomyxa filosa]|uniref:Kelch motif family protein n=1 Tax=Reticulomyxa filosa TaxID=46433 RepID=X6P2N2_RETFI|nr:hypothetical protein RFI_04642 [Reticulomyxa filosa]|eukprot:ETO32476.1 hypothetical protein RFI_04642 [Reticulomyxa filosa]